MYLFILNSGFLEGRVCVSFSFESAMMEHGELKEGTFLRIFSILLVLMCTSRKNN
jgi:hypothetical protein